MNNNIQAIILAAGKSTRFHTERTKLAETICGQAMILFPTKLLAQLHIATTIVVGYQQEIIRSLISQNHTEHFEFAVQEKQEGTGHALACTQSSWHKDHILVLNGDVPLITDKLITALYEEHIKNDAVISFVRSCCTDETGKSYGRIVKNENRIAIVEAKDFSGDIKEHCCINAGIYLIKKDFLQNYIATLNDNNASKEFYITDLVKIASENNLTVATVQAPFDTIRGINTFQELAKVEEIKRQELINYWMDCGVHFTSPHQVGIDTTVSIDAGTLITGAVHLRGTTIIGKNCIISEFSSLKNVIIEDDVIINSHCVIADAYIKSHAQVGPFAHIRTHTTIGNYSAIGNFVEVKKSTIADNSKAKHLSYIGDATIGNHVNIGAGTITCNYDGINKHQTIIEDNAFIGSNNTLIAPITIGNNAFTAAGSTLTDIVPSNALAIARSPQITKPEYAIKLKRQTALHVAEKKAQSDEFSCIGARLIHPDISLDKND